MLVIFQDRFGASEWVMFVCFFRMETGTEVFIFILMVEKMF